MELESRRLLLKEITWNDLEDIHKLYSAPETDEYNTLGIPENLEETREILRLMIEAQETEDRKSYSWKIVRKNTGKFIGMAGITLSANRFRFGEICYEILPSCWGKGYATEVAITIIDAGFRDFCLHRIEAGVATENIASIRVLEKSGMTREGTKRKVLPIRGEWKDSYLYAILENE
ncbi:MAG: GNAT family N-acetyltransferase [Candidatus Azobacteroides sp.]|nr:GNAT family N-acetyltransferase [Candidatus Azobacteroides sp.]